MGGWSRRSETDQKPQLLRPALLGATSAGSGIDWSPDSSSVFFDLYPKRRARHRDDALPHAPRSKRRRLAAQALSDGKGFAQQMYQSPDAKHVYFTQGPSQISQDVNLYVVDVSGDSPSAPVVLNGPLVAGGSLEASQLDQVTARWSPDSTHVAYIADALQKGLREAFIVDAVNAPGKPKRLNTSLPGPTSAITDLGISPDGSWVLLLGDIETAGVPELFLVPLGASGSGSSAENRRQTWHPRELRQHVVLGTRRQLLRLRCL